MYPVIAIVGRPNVGKSTLFNYLTRSRSALVADEPGVTRDRQYGEGHFHDQTFIVIDTGGIEAAAITGHDLANPATQTSAPSTVELHSQSLFSLMWSQVAAAVREADILFWVVDARAGPTPSDQRIAEQLRTLNKTIYLVVNKADGMAPEIACAEFYSLGFTHLFPTAANQGQGVGALLEAALANFPVNAEEVTPTTAESAIKVAIIGRPNVGKSTLVNRILGEERVLVYDAPGTTRDSVFIPFQRHDKNYVLIDTAGVRRRRSISDTVEKFSVVKTLQAIAAANVVVFVIDARQNLADQDLHLLGFVLDAGRALVLAVNKWDGLPETDRQAVKRSLDRRLQFVTFARIHYISALHGSSVGTLFPAINEAYRSATRKLVTGQLTEILEQAVAAHQPPAVQGRRIKLRYAHPGGSNPPVIVIHGNQTDALPDSYIRYLANFFRDKLRLVGTPLRIQLKSGDNPYKDKKNQLTPRQVERRRRLMTHVKSKK